MSKRIPLSQGKFATVDDKNYQHLMKWKWYATLNGNRWYAARQEGIVGFRKTIYMHIAIMNPPKGMKIDHKNDNGLDNRESNLRICTKSQNQCNIGARSNSSHGYKGACYVKSKNKFVSHIKLNRKPHFLGYYDTAEEAAKAYDKAALELHGEFAKLNFTTNKKDN